MSETASQTERLILPYTVYAGAVVYGHRSAPDRYVYRSHLFTVSGREPLTCEEAAARCRQATEAAWSESPAGPITEYGPPGVALSWMVITSAD